MGKLQGRTKGSHGNHSIAATNGSSQCEHCGFQRFDGADDSFNVWKDDFCLLFARNGRNGEN